MDGPGMMEPLCHSPTGTVGLSSPYSHTGQGLQGTNSKGRSFMRGYPSAKHEQIGIGKL